MKSSLVITCILILSTTIFSQEIVIKKYKTGEIASKETKTRWGDSSIQEFREEKVEVFNIKGEKVFEGNRRRYAGHASVYLTYHENGGVKKIETSSAPDAGIQWYKAKYILDEKGNIIEKSEDSHDRTTRINPTIFFEPTEVHKTPNKPAEMKPQETVKCANIVQSTVIIYNKTNKPITVNLTPKSNPSYKSYHVKLSANDSIITQPIINAEIFLVPADLYQLKIAHGQNKKTSEIKFSELPALLHEPDKQHRIYKYYWVGE
jgi:hypothetical protein